MKFLLFPLLCIEMILKLMLPLDLISLSCSSTKLKAIIKQFRFLTTERMFSTEQHANPKCFGFTIFFPNVDRHLLISFQHAPRSARRAAGTFSGEINGIRYPFRYVFSQNAYILYPGERNGLLIFDYIIDLVKVNRVDKLDLNLELVPNVPEFASLECIKNVFHVRIHGENPVPFDQLATLSNNLNGPFQYIRITPEINGDVDPNWKMFTSEQLYIEYANWMQREHLLSMKGEYLYAAVTHFDEEDMIAFIRQWMNSTDTTFKNFMNINHRIFDRERIITEFNAVPWDAQRRAKVFVCWGITFRNIVNYPIDCSDGFDFEREDGLLATIRVPITLPRMGFFVWHDRFPVRNVE